MRWKIDTPKAEWEIEFEKGSKFKDSMGRKYEISSTEPWEVVMLGGKQKVPIKVSKEKFFKKLFEEWKAGKASLSGFKFYYKNK